MTNVILIITWHSYNSTLIDILYAIRGQFNERRKLTLDEAKELLYTIREDYPDAHFVVSPYSHLSAVELLGLEI